MKGTVPFIFFIFGSRAYTFTAPPGVRGLP
jgi:hypothetical protein